MILWKDYHSLHWNLNWNSLGVQDYVSRCEQAITKFESLVNQIQKDAGDIEERLQLIKNVTLFKSPPLKAGCTLPEAKVCDATNSIILYFILMSILSS